MFEPIWEAGSRFSSLCSPSDCWDPLTAINYGVYLTALGIGVLWLAITFERRREALLAWAQRAKEEVRKAGNSGLPSCRKPAESAMLAR